MKFSYLTPHNYSLMHDSPLPSSSQSISLPALPYFCVKTKQFEVVNLLLPYMCMIIETLGMHTLQHLQRLQHSDVHLRYLVHQF